ncbi:hypothetical protein S83_008249, partial [Arachis hypogaea]
PLPHRAAGLATARKVKERSCRLSPVAVDVNHQLLVLSALTQEEMERSEIIKRCVYFYEEMRSKNEDLMLFFVLTLFVYFRDRTSGQLSLGGRMNSRIRREALERIVGEGDRNCIWELRMNTNAFANLCELLEVQGGLNEDGHGCLGALDGTYIEVTVPESEKAKYRTRKGKICTNVLGVCNREMGFVYVLSGWEGSASDSRVLRDAITHRNSLKIPH